MGAYLNNNAASRKYDTFYRTNLNVSQKCKMPPMLECTITSTINITMNLVGLSIYLQRSEYCHMLAFRCGMTDWEFSDWISHTLNLVIVYTLHIVFVPNEPTDSALSDF